MLFFFSPGSHDDHPTQTRRPHPLPRSGQASPHLPRPRPAKSYDAQEADAGCPGLPRRRQQRRADGPVLRPEREGRQGRLHRRLSQRHRAAGEAADLERRQLLRLRHAAKGRRRGLHAGPCWTTWRKSSRSMRKRVYATGHVATGRSWPTGWPRNFPTASPPSPRWPGRWGRRRAARSGRCR